MLHIPTSTFTRFIDYSFNFSSDVSVEEEHFYNSFDSTIDYFHGSDEDNWLEIFNEYLNGQRVEMIFNFDDNSEFDEVPF